MYMPTRYTSTPTKTHPDAVCPSNTDGIIPEAQVSMARIIWRLVQVLSEYYDAPEPLFVDLEVELQIPKSLLELSYEVADQYLCTRATSRCEFTTDFLGTAGLKKLHKFAPVLRAIYEKKLDLDYGRVVMTPNSIELLVEVDKAKYGWVHLRDLSEEEITRFAQEFLKPYDPNAAYRMVDEDYVLVYVSESSLSNRWDNGLDNAHFDTSVDVIQTAKLTGPKQSNHDMPLEFLTSL